MSDDTPTPSAVALSAAQSTTIKLTGDRDLARRLPLFDMCAFLGLVGLLVAIGFRRVEVLALAAPFVVAVAAALASWRAVDGTVQLHFDKGRILEGDEVTVVVEISSERGIDHIELELFPNDRLVAVGTLRAVTSVRAGATTTLSFTVQANDWGVANIGLMTIRVADRFAMFGGQIEARPAHTVRIGLPEDRISASLEAERFRRIVGSHLSRDRGQGQEIADIRPFQPGDSTRSINWRISNRRQEPWVTLRHPDRSSTVVVVVDAHDGDAAEQRVTHRRSVSAAMALSRGHLAMHDQVGLLVVGHTLQWVPPKLGRNHLFRIADQLVAVSNAPEASRRMYRPPAVSEIPNNAIVVAISPLRDPRMVSLMAEIRSRGNPVSVLVPADEAVAKPGRLQGRTEQHARRFSSVEQRIGVQSLRERGVAIVPWESDQAVITVIESVHRLRRTMARARTW